MIESHQPTRAVLDRMIGTSVVFNGVLIPASILTAALARYVDNLSVWNDHETYKVSLVGSAVPIKFAERYFLLCTNHQLRGCQPENVSLLGRDGKMLITSSGVRHFNDERNPYYLDLAAFDFTEPCEAHQYLKERFFTLREVPPDAPATDIMFAVVAGFPSRDQRYELEEKNHIGKVKRIVVCQLDPSSYDPALLCLRTDEPLDFDPDGMSGGSAFVVQVVAGEFRAYFAGLVVTGGKDRFHIIKVGHIYRFLKTLV
ncbi:hypothetical protein ABIB06_004442 [Bradyrhizobium sp. LB8.2]|uniref:hypothetical protein n=1 Tax=unclassified Bradyrhizobium TaxID=2631580 RepID=UPI0033933320